MALMLLGYPYPLPSHAGLRFSPGMINRAASQLRVVGVTAAQEGVDILSHVVSFWTNIPKYVILFLERNEVSGPVEGDSG